MVGRGIIIAIIHSQVVVFSMAIKFNWEFFYAIYKDYQLSKA